MPRPRPDVPLFWRLADPMIAAGEAEEGTMMGFHCLRVKGRFIATVEHDSHDLIVKLPEARVDELIAAGIGQPFAPAGRRFREWVAIAAQDEALWRTLLDEAADSAASAPPEVVSARSSRSRRPGRPRPPASPGR